MPTVFDYPFRIFFLSAAAFAALAVPLWALFVTGLGPPIVLSHWHPHELLAGLLHAAAAGFLLTAVCNWTNSAPLRGPLLLGLWLVWLLPRLGFAAGLSSPWLLLVDSAFLPLVLLAAARPVIAVRQWRQLPLLAALAALWLADVAFHLSDDVRWLHLALAFGGLLLLLVGSRITPAFSRNWLRGRGGRAEVVGELPWLPPLLYGAFSLYLLLHVLALSTSLAWLDPLQALLAATTAGLITLRLIVWSPWSVRGEPLLWILFAGLLWIPVGLLLRALALMELLPIGAWQHALGAGAIGTMILGVMARVALGHTGRPMQLPGGMLTAFGLVLVAATLRVLVACGIVDWRLGVLASGLAWSVAFMLFLWCYSAVLIRPRIDGAAG